MKSTNKSLLTASTLAVTVSVGLATSPAFATHGGSPSPELTVVGHIDAAAVGVPFGENVTDVWAAQSSSNGRDYAYLGTFDDIACMLDTTGTHIIDITDPASPFNAGFIADKPGTRTNDVKVAHLETPRFSGEILVASNESCGSGFIPRLNANGGGTIPGQGGVAIWDVTDPTDPKVFKQNFLDFGVHNTYIWQQGLNAYMLVVDDDNVQDLHIVDITKPQSPREIAVTGQLDWPENDNIGDGEVFLHDVWVQNNIAYLSYWDAGLVLLDVSDPSNPVFLGDSEYITPDPLSGEAPEGNSHVAVPNADGTRVLMGDEDFAAGSLTSFQVGGADVDAAEGAFTTPVFSLPAASFAGVAVTQGGSLGCTAADLSAAPGVDSVAIIQRGVCRFDTKAQSAIDQGYVGMVVYNDAARGDALVSMSGDPRNIVGFFVGNTDGNAIANGATIAATGLFDGYGYLRLLDVSDPANIVELDQFATEHVFDNPPLPGDRTMHNIVVNEGTTAYISWYAEGMRVVEFTGDTLVESAHFVDTDDGSNFWGVYLYEHSDGNTYILGSDRSTGLWIFETP
ncbi:MAG: hypothetical protein OES26_10110 [Gammaproteobacteria bacterium]|nr:hypothetical protein [Gammaproteobacteria bacterium]